MKGKQVDFLYSLLFCVHVCLVGATPQRKTKVGVGFHGAVSVKLVLTIGYSLIHLTCAAAHRCGEFKSSALPLIFRPYSLCDEH